MPFDAEKADRVVRLINSLKHTKGKFAGTPFNLRPWQEEIVRKVYGTVNEKGLRQYRTVFIELPRKNGKSELGAAFAIVGLCGDGEVGAEVYSAATDRDQASLVFNVARDMVRQSKRLNARLDVKDFQKTIEDTKTGTTSTYKAISSEASSKHGFNASTIIYDELHAAPNRELYDVLETSQGAREQPLFIVISTAGEDKRSIMYELHDYAVRVRDGELDDPSFLPVIYAMDPEDDWTLEEVWHKANPALGDFRSLEEMRIAFRKAKEIPARAAVFRRLYLNSWEGSSKGWINLFTWDEAEARRKLEELKGRPCYGGLDLASVRDVTAFVLIFPDLEGGAVDVVPRFFAPEEGAKDRERRDRVPYLQWAREGFLRLTPGNVTDYAFIRAAILEDAEAFDLRGIAYDRWNASQLVVDLTDDGANMVPWGQGFASMASPLAEMERFILARKFRHGGDPVLRWMAGNATTVSDPAGNLKLDKSKSSDRIDGLVAAAMGLGLMAKTPEETPDPPSVYEERGLIVL